jgi:hypothetical protein
MAIQDEVSIIETVTTNGNQIGFAAAPRIHQTEVAKLIESVHGPGTANTFLDQVHHEGRSYIDLESGVQISGSSEEHLGQEDTRRGTVGALADAQDVYGNLFQLNYTQENEDAVRELIQRAGLPDLLTIRARNSWLHGQAPLPSLEPDAGTGFEPAEINAREAAINSGPQQALIYELDEWGEPRRQQITPGDEAVRADARAADERREQTNETVEKTTKEGSHLRFETSTRTAEYQPDTNTVDFTNKTTSTKSELVPGEGLSGSPESAEAVRSSMEEVFGAKIDRDEFDNSDQPLEIADRTAEQRRLENALALASHELKTDAQVTLADKNDGIYKGNILGVTDSYLLQRSGPASAVAHDKGIFENLPGYGRDVTILYSAGTARLNVQPGRDKGLGIER